MKQSLKKKWFTMLELVLALVTFAIVFIVLFTLFLRMIRMKTEVEARQTLIKNTYDTVEKINVMLQDYTIDYEEYFNRSMMGCTSHNSWGQDFEWNVSTDWYCTQDTLYGNTVPVIDNYTYAAADSHTLYACSSFLSGGTVAGPNNLWSSSAPQDTRLIVWYDVSDGPLACATEFYRKYSCGGGTVCSLPFRQPYGAYKIQFLDVKADVDDKFGRAWDDDDTDTGKWPSAIFDNTNIKELYLISKDKKKRVIIRRNRIAQADFNGDSIAWNVPTENLYTLQMLQLKGFDAGDNHDFDAMSSSGVYDGVIDTWACDAEAWFTCAWPSVWGIYSAYRLPVENNPQDGWVNIMTNDVSVIDWNMTITPTKDPEYAWWEPIEQRNPFITLYIKTAVYGQNWVNKIWIANVNAVTYDLQTSFNVKSNY